MTNWSRHRKLEESPEINKEKVAASNIRGDIGNQKVDHHNIKRGITSSQPRGGRLLAFVCDSPPQ